MVSIQVYIMLRQWTFPWYTVLSAVISLLLSAWSITTLEKARVIKDEELDTDDFKVLTTIVYFVNQLVVLVSRLFAIAVFAYVFKHDMFLLLLLSWLISCALFTCIACIYISCKCTFCYTNTNESESSVKCSYLPVSLLLTFFVSETVL
ncbi:XK-related 6 [Paramuricea clavata]|uniref:XK-related protein n=1 Tax=Paramuricea clavata TaxID=317549 RepID=A0A6S7K649_PARCT|nr:XK-related 6 [Paramuricea clavata]